MRANSARNSESQREAREAPSAPENAASTTASSYARHRSLPNTRPKPTASPRRTRHDVASASPRKNRLPCAVSRACTITNSSRGSSSTQIAPRPDSRSISHTMARASAGSPSTKARVRSYRLNKAPLPSALRSIDRPSGCCGRPQRAKPRTPGAPTTPAEDTAGAHHARRAHHAWRIRHATRPACATRPPHPHPAHTSTAQVAASTHHVQRILHEQRARTRARRKHLQHRASPPPDGPAEPSTARCSASSTWWPPPQAPRPPPGTSTRSGPPR